MKKHSIVISAILSAAIFNTAAALPVCADEADAAAAPSPIQLYTGSVWEYEWSDEANCAFAESACPQVTMDEETAKQYPELAEAFKELNEQQKTEFSENYQTNLADAKERFQENPDYTGTYTDGETYYVVRADQNIVSLLGIRTGYLGGAHGYEVYYGMNYDPAGGTRLKLSDLVTDEGAFKEKVKEEVYAKYPYVDEDLTEEYFEDVSVDDMTWTAGYEGITCYFDAYTLGPYAMGSQKILIPYEGNEAMIADTAADVPENYGIGFPAGEQVSVGGREIEVYGNLSEYGSYDSISIILDGVDTDFDDIYTYSIAPSFLRMNGEDYLYLEFSSDNDYRLFNIYRLGEKPEFICESDLASAYMYVDEDSYTAGAAMSDPENLLLSTRIDLLGTMSGYRSYHVGADGTPQANEPYFHISSERDLTTKEELVCEEVDEDGNQTGSIMVPAGTKMQLLRTDNDSVFDLKLEDGRIARVEVSAESYPHTINGENIEDIFDGIMFAG